MIPGTSSAEIAGSCYSLCCSFECVRDLLLQGNNMALEMFRVESISLMLKNV